MNKQKNKIIAIIFFFFLFSFSFNVNGEEDKTIVSLKIDYENNKKISIIFLIGEKTNLTEIDRKDIIYAKDNPALWNKIWINYTENFVEREQLLIIGKFNNSFNTFIEKILGIQNNTLIIKKLQKIQYATAIGIEVEAINPISTITIFPLRFIIEDKSLNVDTNIKVSVGYDISMIVKFNQDKFSTTHYRALLFESIEYQKKTNEITIIESSFLSPSFLFIFLIICTIVCIGLTFEASRRNERISVSVLPWVISFILYFLAFIPYSNFLIYIVSIIGIIIAGDRFRKGIIFGRKSKRERYHQAMAKEAKISAKTLLSEKEFEPEKVIPYDTKVSPIIVSDSDFIYEKLDEYGNSYFTIPPSSIEIYKELGMYAEDIYLSGILEEEFIDEGEEIKLYEKVEEKRNKN